MKLITAILWLGFTLAIAAPSPQTVSINLKWDYNFATQPDVKEFRIYYGIGNDITNWNGTNVFWRQYTSFQPVGQFTNVVLTNLQRGNIYYIGITAVNTNGIESDFGSHEVRTNTPPKPTGPRNLRGP